MGEIAGLYYEERGPAGASPLILSSGLGGSAAYWGPNLDALTAEHHVILYDHRGTGRSDRTLPAAVSVEDMARDLFKLMNGLNLRRATIVGHAAGAAIGFALALHRPDYVDRLVAINGWSRPHPHFIACFETRLALLRNSGVEAFVRAQPLFLYPSRWIAENGERIAAEALLQIAHFPGVANVEARIAALAAFDIDARLAEIRAPTLLIAAEDDMLVPPQCSERLLTGLPDATLALMAGGHACNVTGPDRFNRILRDWLDVPARLKGAA